MGILLPDRENYLQSARPLLQGERLVPTGPRLDDYNRCCPRARF